MYYWETNSETPKSPLSRTKKIKIPHEDLRNRLIDDVIIINSRWISCLVKQTKLKTPNFRKIFVIKGSSF